jgi:hypothetical protein
LSIFNSVQFWIKINNQIKIIFFQVFEPIEPKTGSNRPVSVQFGFFPFQTANRNYFNWDFFLGFFIGHNFKGFCFCLVSIFLAMQKRDQSQIIWPRCTKREIWMGLKRLSSLTHQSWHKLLHVDDCLIFFIVTTSLLVMLGVFHLIVIGPINC